VGQNAGAKFNAFWHT